MMILLAQVLRDNIISNVCAAYLYYFDINSVYANNSFPAKFGLNNNKLAKNCQKNYKYPLSSKIDKNKCSKLINKNFLFIRIKLNLKTIFFQFQKKN